MGGVTESKKVPLVLLHGWGLNQQIWNVGQGSAANHGLAAKLRERFEVHLLDLPGYGDDLDYDGGYHLPEIGARVLGKAPKRALWAAWSLGATVAMQAAMLAPDRFLGLQLLAPTPRFRAAPGWPHGVDDEALLQLKQKFEIDYQHGLRYFLLLQTTNRNLVRASFDAICEAPLPTPSTVMRSLDLLTETDLRQSLGQIRVPIQIALGMEDRIVPPAASRALFDRLASNGSPVTIKELRGGHLFFLESEFEYLKTINEFAGAACGS